MLQQAPWALTPPTPEPYAPDMGPNAAARPFVPNQAQSPQLRSTGALSSSQASILIYLTQPEEPFQAQSAPSHFHTLSLTIPRDHQGLVITVLHRWGWCSGCCLVSLGWDL